MNDLEASNCAYPSAAPATGNWPSHAATPSRTGGMILPPGVTRILLAGAVLISHLSHYDVGRIAVIIFLFLSGYWTSRIWTEKFGERQFIQFYLARALRLYPLFLIVTIASSLARGIPLSLENFLLIGIASTGNDPTNVSWSLDIEMQYYLLCPLLLPCLRRYPAFTIAAGTLVTAAAWSLSSQWEVRTALLYLPAFLLGAVSDQTRNVPSTRTAYLSLGAFAAATAIVYFTPFFSKKMPEPFPRGLFALLWFLPLIPYLQRSLATPSSRLDRRLGEYSYAFYLVHFPIIALVVINGTVLEKALATAISIGLAAALYLVVDEPLNKMRYHLVKLTERRSIAPPSGLRL